MQYLFPYHKVDRNSAVILYGMGNVGKQFYRQLSQTKYCNIIGWSDRLVGTCTKMQTKLIPANKILEMDFDYLVIAVASCDTAWEIQTELVGMGIDSRKIVWEENYELHDLEWPDNLDYFLQNGDFLLKIMDIFCLGRQQFGEGRFYQSYPALGLKGQRPTQERIESYGLREILKKHMNVLDIGCNCGFFDMQIAGLVNSVTGLELNQDLVQIANLTKQFLGKENCTFLEYDFCAWDTESQYDMIFAFAILCWIGMEPSIIAERMVSLSREGGFLLIESHNIHSRERLKDFHLCIENLTEKGMHIIRYGTVCDDGVICREFVLLKNVGNNGK